MSSNINPTNNDLYGIIDSEYEIIRLLGKGNFSKVYLAHNIKNNEQVAIKIFDNKETFSQEIKKNLSFSHPNIIKTFKSSTNNDFSYIVMEYLSNGTLENYLIIPHRLDRILSIILDVCKGLDYIHSHNILHCDLKTDNILLDCNNKAHISDMGLSLLSGEIPDIHEIHYSSPEVNSIYNSPIDNRSDIYSLGIIFYQLLVKERLFNTPGYVILPPSYFNPEVTESTNQLVLSMLRINPSDRPQNCQEIIDSIIKIQEELKFVNKYEIQLETDLIESYYLYKNNDFSSSLKILNSIEKTIKSSTIYWLYSQIFIYLEEYDKAIQ